MQIVRMFCSKKWIIGENVGKEALKQFFISTYLTFVLQVFISHVPLHQLLDSANFQRLKLNFTLFEVRAFQRILFQKIKVLWVIFTAHLQLKGVVRNGKVLQGNETNLIPKLRWGCEQREQKAQPMASGEGHNYWHFLWKRLLAVVLEVSWQW